MSVTGSSPGNTLPAELDDKLRTGRWPAEEQALLKRRTRVKVLGEMFHEAIDELVEYQTSLAIQLGIRPEDPPPKGKRR